MASFVRIALADAGSFAIMGIVEGDTIGHLAERACIKFPSWKADSAQISLYLVAAGGDEEPAEEVISAVLSSGGRLGVGWSLSRAGISSGAWLVARKIVDCGASRPSFAAFTHAPPPFSLHPLPPHSQVQPSLVAAAVAAVAASPRVSACAPCWRAAASLLKSRLCPQLQGLALSPAGCGRCPAWTTRLPCTRLQRPRRAPPRAQS